jgi:hypothetical protein
LFLTLLANVTPGLPEHFELAGGPPEANIAWYYEVVTTTVIASPGGFWLVLAIPLKDVSAQYEIAKAYTFPTEVLNGTYVEVYLEKPYLAINLALNTRLDLSEADLANCKDHDEFLICPADKAVMNREFETCLLSLYLQAEDAHSVRAEVARGAPGPIFATARHGHRFLHPRGAPGLLPV